ncbi:MAG: HIT family protein [Dysgonamonadaceae bacterium]|jgi:histidine triad (HIT) family protein|nr:HIT family protein [Dysgonamonadaceae bacterium]
MTVFSKIIAGEISSYKIAEDENFYSFLDINPVAKGHVLVIPKQEIDYIFDLSDDTLAQMMLFSKKVAKAMSKVIKSKRIGIAVMGLEVPHAHIHLIPISEESDMSFRNPKKKFSPEEFEAIARSIREAFE